MLKTHLLHPRILAALAGAGHGSQVLISDGNYPHSTARGANAELVYLNLAPGMPTVTDVLKVLVTAIPVEAAFIMDTAKTGPHVLAADPPVWSEYEQILAGTSCAGKLTRIERFAFYEAASKPTVCLTVATGEQRIYANLLLTIGVVQPKNAG